MPLKLCHCDKVKLNRVLDQVKALSTTVDELREEIDLLKPCFVEQSSDDETLVNCDSFNKRDNVGPIRRLKKCLERNVSPIISRDTRYRVKKRCQQFFSQSPQTVPCSAARLSSREVFLRRQRCASPLSVRTNCRKNVSCQTAESRVKQASSNLTRKCIKPTKFTTVSTTSSTDSSIPKKSCCSYKICGITKSYEPSHQRRRERRKTTEPAATLTSKKYWCKKEENCENIPSRILPCVNYIEKKKYVAAVSEDSSTSSCILTSKTSIDHLPIRKTNFRQSKKKSNDKMKNNAKEEKLVVPQCSPGCLYANGSKLYPKDMSTNTIIQNLAKNEIFENNHRTKQLECQETQTQTFIKFQEIKVISFNAYENETKCLCEQMNSISLTSCSPRIITLESEKSPRADHEKITFAETKRVSEGSEKINFLEQPKVYSTDWNDQKPTEISSELQRDEEFANNRLKRTYVISPRMLSTKTDGKVDQDSNEQTKDLSFISACLKLEETISPSNCRCGLEEKDSRRTVSTNRRKIDYLLKFPFWPRKKSQETPPSSSQVIDAPNPGNASPCSPQLSDGSCSLTSNWQH